VDFSPFKNEFVHEQEFTNFTPAKGAELMVKIHHGNRNSPRLNVFKEINKPYIFKASMEMILYTATLKTDQITSFHA
jgi:hypothetical protein